MPSNGRWRKEFRTRVYIFYTGHMLSTKLKTEKLLVLNMIWVCLGESKYVKVFIREMERRIRASISFGNGLSTKVKTE